MTEILNRQAIKKRIDEITQEANLGKALEDIANLPLKSAINALLPKLLSVDEDIKWRVVTIAGVLIARLADIDMEAARLVIRRQIWNLTEESGTCAYGAPEMMAEAMANHRGLAEEYANILISYIIPEGNYLEHEPLQRGVVWGIGHLAEVYPDLVQEAEPYLRPLLKSDDVDVKGLAQRALNKIGKNDYIPRRC